CALIDDGTVKCWGDNRSLQLGAASFGASSSTPVAVAGVVNAVGVAAGATHTCAVLATGGVTCWGSNTSGELGAQGGNGTASSSGPLSVAVSGAVQVSCGNGFSCALQMPGGRALCWGNNGHGQLGRTTSNQYNNAPLDNPTLQSFVTLDAGDSHVCAIRPG